MRVRDCELIPSAYGIAYRDPARMESICYPLPLNWLVRWARSAYWALAAGMGLNRWERALALARDEGYKAGKAAAAAYDEGWQAAFDALNAELDRSAKVRQLGMDS